MGVNLKSISVREPESLSNLSQESSELGVTLPVKVSHGQIKSRPVNSVSMGLMNGIIVSSIPVVLFLFFP